MNECQFMTKNRFYHENIIFCFDGMKTGVCSNSVKMERLRGLAICTVGRIGIVRVQVCIIDSNSSSHATASKVLCWKLSVDRGLYSLHDHVEKTINTLFNISRSASRSFEVRQPKLIRKLLGSCCTYLSPVLEVGFVSTEDYVRSLTVSMDLK